MLDETLQVQARFDDAAGLHLSPCAWIPPKWEELLVVGGKRRFRHTPPDLPKFEDPDYPWDKTPDDRLEEGQTMDNKQVHSPEEIPSSQPGNKAWVSPYSDFTHVDDNEYPNADLTLISAMMTATPMDARIKSGVEVLVNQRDAITQDIGDNEAIARFDGILEVLKGNVRTGRPGLKQILKDFDGGPVFSAITHVLDPNGRQQTPGPKLKAFIELRNTLRQMGVVSSARIKQKAVTRLRTLVGPDTAGMKRLERTFDWILYRATELLADLNTAIDTGAVPYRKARDNYIAFLRDLDDHEPHKTGKKLDPCGDDPDHPQGPKKKLRKSGYGITIKWNCLQPVIPEEGDNAGKIVGTRVVIQWNPHSSSNGVPIKH